MSKAKHVATTVGKGIARGGVAVAHGAVSVAKAAAPHLAHAGHVMAQGAMAGAHYAMQGAAYAGHAAVSGGTAVGHALSNAVRNAPSVHVQLNHARTHQKYGHRFHHRRTYRARDVTIPSAGSAAVGPDAAYVAIESERPSGSGQERELLEELMSLAAVTCVNNQQSIALLQQALGVAPAPAPSPAPAPYVPSPAPSPSPAPAVTVNRGPAFPDPKTNPNLPESVRKDFAAHEKEFVGYAEKMRVACNGEAVEFTADYERLWRDDTISQSYRDKLGGAVWGTYARAVCDTFVRWAQDRDNLQAFRMTCSRRRIELRVSPNNREDNNSRYQQLWFDDGALVVQCTGSNFATNLYEISATNLDHAFDDQAWRLPAGYVAPQPTVDVKTCWYLPLRVRKDFRDHEKQFVAHSEKIGKALGGVPVALECDFAGMFYDEKLSKDYRFKLGSNVYDGYWRDVAQLLHNYADKDPDNRAAFLSSCTARRVVVRLAADNRDDLAAQTRYQQMFFESGKLVVQCTADHFRTNMYELSATNLDLAFDDQVQRAGTLSPGPGGASVVDPKSCPLIAHRTRKDFRDHEKQLKQHLEKIAKALGGVYITFEADFPALFADEQLSKDYRYKLGANLYDGYVRDFAQLIHNWADKDPDNRAAFVAACAARAFVFRLGDNNDDNNARYQQMSWENGKLVIQCTANNFRTNMYELSGTNLDLSFDSQVERKLVLAPGQIVDPKTCLFLPLRVRKDFRDHEKPLKQHLEKIAKALGGVAIAFEADYPALFSEEKLSKDYRFKLGSNLYDGYVRDFAQAVHNWADKDADNRAAFVASCTARAFVFRLGDNNDDNNARYQQMSWENGKLVIQCTPDRFRTNMYELSATNLDLSFDSEVAKAMVVDASTAVDPKTCLFFPLRVRKDFRDHEKEFGQSMERIGKALGVGMAWACNYPAIYSDEKLAKDYKFKLGSNLYAGYVKDIAQALNGFASDAKARDALVSACSARVIEFRLADDAPAGANKPAKGTYQQVFVVGGRLVFQCSADRFRTNMYEISKSNIEAAL